MYSTDTTTNTYADTNTDTVADTNTGDILNTHQSQNADSIQPHPLLLFPPSPFCTSIPPFSQL